MSRQRIRHFAVALALSAIMTAASAAPAQAGFASPTDHARPGTGVAAVAPAGVADAAPTAIAYSVTGKPSREVFGFALASSLSDPTIGYPSWNFDVLSTVAFFGVHVDTAGHFVGDSGWNVWNSSALTTLRSTAHQHGARVVLTIVLQDFSANTPNMCAGLAHMDATVAQTAAEVRAKGVDGVNIDYEGLDGSCGGGDPYWAQHAMTTFTQKMRATLGSSSYISVDTYSGSAGDPYGFFDIGGIATYADSLFVMAYDMEYSNYSSAPVYCSRFCLGPTAPLTGYRYNDTSIMSQYVAVAPRGKVILGVPYYGRKACVGNATSPSQYPTTSVVADSYLDASGEAAYFEVKAGSYAAHRDASSAGMERWDTWYNTRLNCIRELYWDDAVSLGKKYDLVNADGLRGVGIWNLNYGGGAPELWAALQTHFAACRGAAVTVNPKSPQPIGAQVHFIATSTGCPSPVYQFWVLAPGAGSWQIARAYSTSATFDWNTAGKAAGGYRFSVWVRDARSPGTSCGPLGCNDAFVPGFAYTLTAVPCASVTAAAAPLVKATRGTAVTFTATASGCPNPLYEFWIQAPGSSAWAVLRAYANSATVVWNTTGKAAGTYRVSVWARDSASAGTSCGSMGCYDAFAGGSAYTLYSFCASMSMASSPASPAKTGSLVTFSAAASSCSSPLYQFWVQAPGSSTWTVVQAYSTAATFRWNTTAKPSGTYRLSVWARDASSAGSSCGTLGCYDTFVPGTAYRLYSPCVSVSFTTLPPSSAKAGASVTITAGASGCSSPLYQFWILAPGSSTWQVAQAYSAGATFTWNTAGKPAGTYRISVWARDAGSPGAFTSGLGRYDAYGVGPYTLT